MEAKEGCNLEGTVIVNKVPGNFHISGHANGQAIQMLYQIGKPLDFTHTVHKLEFGDPEEQKEVVALDPTFVQVLTEPVKINGNT